MRSWTRTRVFRSTQDQETHGATLRQPMPTMEDGRVIKCSTQKPHTRTIHWLLLERVYRGQRTCPSRPESRDPRVTHNLQLSRTVSSNSKTSNIILSSNMQPRVITLNCRHKILSIAGLRIQAQAQTILIHDRSTATARLHLKNHILRTRLYL
jgi:hypothetical protein